MPFCFLSVPLTIVSCFNTLANTFDKEMVPTNCVEMVPVEQK